MTFLTNTQKSSNNLLSFVPTRLGDAFRPSIAAVVASIDAKSAKYATSIRTQEARLETIKDLESMVIELLRAFHAT
jgi:hypothetical protein